MGETLPQTTLEQAIGHYRAGRWTQAETAYQQLILADPTKGTYHANLGVVLAVQGRFADAAGCLNSALEREPSPEIYNTLGQVFKDLGELDRAISAFRAALMLNDQYAQAHFNLGSVLHLKGAMDEAVAAYRTAIRLQPGYVAAHNNLAHLLCSMGRTEEGLKEYRQAIDLQPGFADAHSNLGSVLTYLGRNAEALVHLRKAAELRPDSPDMLNNLGNGLRCSGEMDGSIEALRRAVALRPGFAEARTNLAAVLKDTGLIGESISCYRAALAIRPDSHAGNGLLFALHHHPDTTAAQLKREHVEWDRQFAAPHTAVHAMHLNDVAPERRLRVGYVGSLGDTPIGRFMLPLMAAHDRTQFDVCCYADAGLSDQMTARLQSHAVTWRDVFSLSDQRLAEQICDDRIDILVDLAMHGGRNRLLTFARKPAPVQVTYLAYAGTTGMNAMDYRLSDPYLDPMPDPGEAAVGDASDYSEVTVRLPNSFWCYEAPKGSPGIARPPCESRGYPTFGCLNSSAKMNPKVLDVWRQILAAVQDSRIVLHSHEGEHRRRVADALIQAGGDFGRVEFVPLLPLREYFEVYNLIDVALDPFPFAGGTTTCDALWMGVPVVTLPGKTAVSRGGKSILSNLGLGELIANEVEQYISLAVRLAGNPGRLAALRRQMRDRMQASPLMDARGFAGGVEAAFRTMWRRWCQGA